MLKLSSICAIIIASTLSEYCNGIKCYPTTYKNITSYSIEPNIDTPEGIPVDMRGVQEEVDLNKIDDIIFNTKYCLEDLGYEEIDLSCLKIKIISDWYLSHDKEWQLFECDMPQSVCDFKVKSGQLPDLDKPCACRAIIQNESIVIPPNLGLLRSELVRLFTGKNYVWTEELATCVNHKLPE